MNKYNNKQKSIKIFFIIIFLSLLSFNFSFAEGGADIMSQNFRETADSITNNVLTSAATLLMTAAFVLFFYGVVVFILGRVANKGDMKSIEKGREFMLWGLIALFVMVSVWGIIKLVQGLFNVEDNNIQIQPVQFAQIENLPPPPKSTLTLKGAGESCQTSLECQQGLQCSQQICVTKSVNNSPQQAADGTTKENPFTNTNLYPVLNPGDSNNSGALRKAIGMLINKNCILNGTIDYNIYNNTDVDMTKKFQQINGLSSDGVIGKDTWEALSVATGQKTTFTGILVKDCDGGGEVTNTNTNTNTTSPGSSGGGGSW